MVPSLWFIGAAFLLSDCEERTSHSRPKALAGESSDRPTRRLRCRLAPHPDPLRAAVTRINHVGAASRAERAIRAPRCRARPPAVVNRLSDALDGEGAAG